MNLDKDNNELQEQLYRYFRKELTVAQEEEVNTWRLQSIENQQRFEEMEVLFLDLKGLAYYRKVDVRVDQSWDQFKADHKVRSIRTASRVLTYLKYAASILILAATAFVIYYVQSSPDTLTVATLAETKEIVLTDNSIILLTEGASLEYSELFQNNERRVSLSGQAHFNVQSIPDQPFVVEVGELEVRVLGTEFFIQPIEDEAVNIIVEEGKVLISYNDLHHIVNGGETAQVDLKNNQVKALNDQTGLATFWKNRKLIFNLTSLEEAVQVVNQAYDTSVQVVGSAEGCALTVTFENETLDTVLEIITSTLGYTLIEDKGNLILKGDGCR